MAKKDLAGLVGGIIGKPATSTATIAKTDRVKDMAAEVRATFICDPELIRKMKYIALASGRLHKQVVAEAFDEYITKWENTHGKIKLLG